MKSSAKASGGTRGRVLESACEVFAEKGYRDATIADICERAKANIASVNYHFGDKESLYAAAWHDAFRASLATYPPDGGVPDDAPPAQRLRARILAILSRIADPHCREFAVVAREMGDPTGLLEEAIREAIDPLREAMSGIVRELLGPAADQARVGLCLTSIIGQCFHWLFTQWHLRHLPDSGRFGGIPHVGPDNVEQLADHITQFSLAGIRAMREQAEATAAAAGETKP